MAKNSIKKNVERILVSKDNQNLLAGGTSLVDGSGNIQLADGQLAIVDASGEGANTIHDALTPGDTISDSPVIKIYQGTANSNDPAGFANGFHNRTYEDSHLIDGRNVVAFKGEICRDAAASAWVIGAASGTGVINVEDSTEYNLNIAMRGWRKEEEYGISGRDTKSPNFVSPDYTALGLVNSRDHLVQSLVKVINLDSRIVSTSGNAKRGNKEYVALAIDSDGGGGGQTLASLTTGVLVTGYGFVITEAMETAIANIIADTANDLAGTSEVVPIDIATAGAVAQGPIAKAADEIILMAGEETKAFEDRIWQKQVRIEVALDLGFNPLVGIVESSLSDEGEGHGDRWIIRYENTHGNKKYSQNRSLYPIVKIESGIDAAAKYSAYIIESVDVNQINAAGVSISPQRTVILVPCVAGATEVNTKGDLEAILNAWVASTPSANAPVVLA